LVILKKEKKYLSIIGGELEITNEIRNYNIDDDYGKTYGKNILYELEIYIY
jgi:hypothetical protein